MVTSGRFQSMLTAVEGAITDCQHHFGRNFLFNGNCGAFAIALAKWMAERFPSENLCFGLMAPVVIFGSAPKEVSMASNAVDYNHVFATVIVNTQPTYFDGDGLVSKEKMQFWFKNTLEWYKEMEFDYGPGRGVVVAAVGGIESETDIMCVESGTDPTSDWTEFFEYLCTIF